MHFDRITQFLWNVQLNIYLQVLFVFIELCPNSMTRMDESFNYVLYCTSFCHLSFIFFLLFSMQNLCADCLFMLYTCYPYW